MRLQKSAQCYKYTTIEVKMFFEEGSCPICPFKGLSEPELIDHIELCHTDIYEKVSNCNTDISQTDCHKDTYEKVSNCNTDISQTDCHTDNNENDYNFSTDINQTDYHTDDYKTYSIWDTDVYENDSNCYTDINKTKYDIDTFETENTHENIIYQITESEENLFMETGQTNRDRDIRPKPDDCINKNHMIEYYYQKTE